MAVSDEFYNDDPIEVDNTTKFRTKFATSAAVVFAAILFFSKHAGGKYLIELRFRS